MKKFKFFLILLFFQFSLGITTSSAQADVCGLLIPLADDLSNPTTGKLLDAFFKQSEGKGVKAWDLLRGIGSDLNIDVPALAKLVDDIAENPALEAFLRNNPSKKDVWELLHKSFYSHDINVLNYVDEIRETAKVGSTTHVNPETGHLIVWRDKFPNLQGGVPGQYFNVHHAIERQVINTRWPNLFNWSEINSIENLRGISGEINAQTHLINIRNRWDEFYDLYPPGGAIPTRQKVLEHVKKIDDEFGKFFSPPIRQLDY